MSGSFVPAIRKLAVSPAVHSPSSAVLNGPVGPVDADSHRQFARVEAVAAAVDEREPVRVGVDLQADGGPRRVRGKRRTESGRSHCPRERDGDDEQEDDTEDRRGCAVGHGSSSSRPPI